MTVVQLLGLLGGAMFAYSAVPEAIRTIRAGVHLRTPLNISLTIFCGTILMYSYLTIAHGFDWVLLVNYAVEGLSWGVLLSYRLWRYRQA